MQCFVQMKPFKSLLRGVALTVKPSIHSVHAQGSVALPWLQNKRMGCMKTARFADIVIIYETHKQITRLCVEAENVSDKKRPQLSKVQLLSLQTVSYQRSFPLCCVTLGLSCLLGFRWVGTPKANLISLQHPLPRSHSQGAVSSILRWPVWRAITWLCC